MTFKFTFEPLQPENSYFLIQVARFDRLNNPITQRFILFFTSIWEHFARRLLSLYLTLCESHVWKDEKIRYIFLADSSTNIFCRYACDMSVVPYVLCFFRRELHSTKLVVMYLLISFSFFFALELCNTLFSKIGT